MLVKVGQNPTEAELHRIMNAADKNSKAPDQHVIGHRLAAKAVLLVQRLFKFMPKSGKIDNAVASCSDADAPTQRYLAENGEIDFEEFVYVIRCCPKRDLKDELREAFQIFDKDGSGAISVDELKQVV